LKFGIIGWVNKIDKGYDRYSRERGFPPNQIGGTVLLVHPQRKETWTIVGIEKGKRLLDMLKWEDKNNREIGLHTILREIQEV